MSEVQQKPLNYPEAVCRILTGKQIRFSEEKLPDGKKLSMTIPTNNIGNTKVILQTHDNGDSSIRTVLPFHVSIMNESKILPCLNRLNSKYRYCNLYIDIEGDICANYDFLLRAQEDVLSEHILTIIFLFTDIVGECVPVIKRAITEITKKSENEISFIKVNLFEED